MELETRNKNQDRKIVSQRCQRDPPWVCLSTCEAAGRGGDGHLKWSFLPTVFRRLGPAPAKLPSQAAHADAPGQDDNHSQPEATLSSTSGNRWTKREDRTEAQHLDHRQPSPFGSGLSPPPALDWKRRSGRRRGRGRALDPVGDRPSRSMPAPAGASETGWVVRREKRRQRGSAPGFYSPAAVARLWQWQDLFSFRHCC